MKEDTYTTTGSLFVIETQKTAYGEKIDLDICFIITRKIWNFVEFTFQLICICKFDRKK